MKIIKNKILFYLLSFTWGLPMTIIGYIAAGALLATKHKPQRWGHCYYFEVGKGWSGVSLGPIFIVSKDASSYTKNHEAGHSQQNCMWGILFPFVIAIPSFIRYWYREIRSRIGKPCTTGYYDIWFEKGASDIGIQFMDWYNNN